MGDRKAINLGSSLDQRAAVLTLRRDTDGNYAWKVSGMRYANVELDTRSNLFSSVGIGARGATIIIRPDRTLTLHNAMRWMGQFLFLTSIIPSQRRDRLEVKSALCTPVECVANAQNKGKEGPAFPGILTEKYVGHAQLDPNAVVTTDYVLVTPKVITLAPGSWVICAGAYYRVLVPHELDEFKNEYEIRRKEDC